VGVPGLSEEPRQTQGLAQRKGLISIEAITGTMPELATVAERDRPKPSAVFPKLAMLVAESDPQALTPLVDIKASFSAARSFVAQHSQVKVDGRWDDSRMCWTAALGGACAPLTAASAELHAGACLSRGW